MRRTFDNPHGQVSIEDRHHCHVFTPIVAAIATEIGVDLGASGAALIGGALTGASVGAIGGGITGGNVGLDALFGGISGGALGGGLGGAVGDALEIGTIGGDALVAGGIGALGSAVQGQNPLEGAALGAAGGALSGAFAPNGAAAGGATSPGASAATAAPPAAVAAGSPVDLATTDIGGAGGLGALGVSPDAGAGVGGAASGGAGGAPSGVGPSGVTSAGQIGSLAGGSSGGGGSPNSGLLSSINNAVNGIGNSLGIGGTAPGAYPNAPNAVGYGGGAAPTMEDISNPAANSFNVGPGTGGGGAPGSTVSGPTSGQQLLGDITGGNLGNVPGDIGSLLTKNPAAAIGALGLGYDVLKGTQEPAGYGQLQAQASALSAQGQQLQSYLQKGTLPPGAQVAVNQATSAIQAQIRSQYASLGLSGSTMEAQALQQAEVQAQAQSFQLADQLLQQGISESDLAANIYTQLVGINQQQNAQIGQGIANFASALGGGGIQLKLAA